MRTINESRPQPGVGTAGGRPATAAGRRSGAITLSDTEPIATPAQPALGNDAIFPSGDGQGRREARWAARRQLRRFSTLRRVQCCGSVAVGPVEVVARRGVGHLRGVATCASIHACPVCSARLREARAREIEAGLKRHLDQGGGAVFVTLTLPHDFGVPLALLWAALAQGLEGVMSGRRWQDDRSDFGIVGVIRAVEVSHGKHGWHPHVHALVLTDEPLTRDAELRLWARIHERWAARIARTGLRTPSIARGTVLVPVATAEAIAAYTAKISDEFGVERSVGREMTRVDTKRGRWFGSRSPFQILGDAIAWGDAQDFALWAEYETASHGRQVLRWSPGLKARLGVEDRTDEDIVAEDLGGTVVATLDAEDWRAIVAAGAEWELVAAASGGSEVVAAVLAVVTRTPQGDVSARVPLQPRAQRAALFTTRGTRGMLDTESQPRHRVRGAVS